MGRGSDRAEVGAIATQAATGLCAGDLDRLDDHIGRPDAAHPRKDRQRGIMRRLARGGHRVADKNLFEPQFESDARGRFHPEVGRDAGQDQRLETAAAQLQFEIGARAETRSK